MANTYQIQSGDTLSGIAQKYNTDVGTLASLNKIQDPNKIYAGSTLNLPEIAPIQPQAPTASSTGGTPFKLDIPQEVPSNDYINAMQNIITPQDIQNLIAKNNQYQQNILGLSQKSQAEKDLEMQLSDIRNKAAMEKQGVLEYESALPSEGISTGAIQGRSIATEREANIKLNRLALEEQNLLSRLGIETENRTSQLEGYKTAYQFGQDLFNNYFQIQTAIRQERQDLYNQTRDLRQDQISTLNTIMSNLQGLDFTDLDYQTQLQLQSLANNLQIPIGTIEQALKVGKDQYTLDVLTKQANLSKKSSTGTYVDSETGQELSPYDAGRSIIESNPNLSDDELYLAIKENVPDLSVTDINKLIATREKPEVTLESAKQTIVDTLTPRKSEYTRSEAKKSIENQLKSALGLKDSDKLPKAYSSMIEDVLVEIYGRTFLQKIFPGGR